MFGVMAVEKEKEKVVRYAVMAVEKEKEQMIIHWPETVFLPKELVRLDTDGGTCASVTQTHKFLRKKYCLQGGKGSPALRQTRYGKILVTQDAVRWLCNPAPRRS